MTLPRHERAAQLRRSVLAALMGGIGECQKETLGPVPSMLTRAIEHMEATAAAWTANADQRKEVSEP